MFRVEREGAVAIVRIDSPPVNALSFARWRSLPPLIRELEDDAGVAALVFTGLPHKHFCGGNDFKEFAALDAQGGAGSGSKDPTGVEGTNPALDDTGTPKAGETGEAPEPPENVKDLDLTPEGLSDEPAQQEDPESLAKPENS